MEFAGVKPEQLGRVKVTSVSECFLAEKEWQTVTRRGAVLACVGGSGFGDGERTGEVVVIEDSDLQSRYDAHWNHPPCVQGGLQANVQRPAYGEL